MSILYLYFAIVGVLIISIIISAISLFSQVKLASRINNLENDIEKKTLEYDALKKERATGQSNSREDSPVDTSTKIFEVPVYNEPQQTTEEYPIEEGSIQIVRNVRGTFETTDTIIPGQGYSDQHADDIPAGHPGGIKTSPVHEAAEVVLPVFSPITGRPEFNDLYKSLIETVKKSAGQAIVFNFSNIESLNDGELEYLEKISAFLANQHRSLTFLHCSGNLAALLRRRPELAPLLR